MAGDKVRVLVVDDDSFARRIVTAVLSRYDDIEVVGSAPDPFVAREMILKLKPDVLTLDLAMPKMEGLTFLRILMEHNPMPVIIMSSYTESNSVEALEALQSGAVEVLGKSEITGSTLAEKVRAASQAIVKSRRYLGVPAPVVRKAHKDQGHEAESTFGTSSIGGTSTLHSNVILMGASTGGVEALRDVLTKLPDEMPGICIVQHIPPKFSKAFAQRLDQLCQIEVREAEDGDRLHSGLALVAPGDFHMTLERDRSGYRVALDKSDRIHHQRPAVDRLFESAVECGAAPNTVAVLLTGMGADGAQGMLRLREAGAHTIAQDAASSVVFGMPKEAIRLGAAERILSLDEVAPVLEGMFTLVPAP